MKHFLASIWIAGAFLVSAVAFALPTVKEVETALRQGQWQKADAQLTQVLQAHPDSAHAHYLYAQVLAREGRPAEGLAELEKARALDPQLKFARDPARFASIEAQLRAAANRAVTHRQTPAPSSSRGIAPPGAGVTPPGASAPPLSAAPRSAAVPVGLWIGLAAVILAIVLVLRFTLRRMRSNDNGRATEQRLAQLKSATGLLNEVRTLKLDLRLSTAPGHAALEREAEEIETQLREWVSQLTNRTHPVPDAQLESLAHRIASLKAGAAGRPDPNPAPPSGNSPSAHGASAYAQEAERFSRNLGGAEAGYGAPPPQQPQQQPPVNVQPSGGGFGGVGGLMTGVLLGDMLSRSHDRVIEREVIVDNGHYPPDTSTDIDVGSGDNQWDDGGNSIDLGSNDDSSNWS